MAERKTIYLCLAHMSDEGWEKKYVKEAFDTNWVVPMGPNVNAFEEDLRKFVTSPLPTSPKGEGKGPADETTVVCLSSGTAAVHLALLNCGVGPGDEVCVQSFTFCASSHPITYCGAKPVFIGSERDTWNMDPELLEEAMRVWMLGRKVECRPVWKPMHKQPVYAGCDVYTNGVEEEIFKVGMCLPAGPYVTDDDVKYIVDSIKNAIVR